MSRSADNMVGSSSDKISSNLVDMDQLALERGESLSTTFNPSVLLTRIRHSLYRYGIAIAIIISLVTAAICLTMSSYNLTKLTSRESTELAPTGLIQSGFKQFNSSNSSTGGEKCPRRWKLNPYTNTCFRPMGIGGGRNWTEAKQYCESFENTWLATFENYESASWLSTQKHNNDREYRYIRHYWIGARYEDGAWRWFGRLTGKIEYSYWGPNEPSHTDEECIDTNADLSWNDNSCSITYPVPICERLP